MVNLMDKTLPMKETMKPVIDALMKGQKTWSDLKTLRVQNREIADKTLDRLLKTLNYWGLAEKDKERGYWVWCENSQVFDSDKKYNLAIEHSRKLLSALDEMKNFYFNLEDPLFLSAKEHLRSYPEVYKNLEKLEKLISPKNKELIQRISQSISDPHKRLEQYMYHPFQLIHFLLAWKPSPDEVETRDNLLAALKPDFEDSFPIIREFSGDISLLKFKVEMGTPLEGKCFSCPKIKIKKGDEKQSE